MIFPRYLPFYLRNHSQLIMFISVIIPTYNRAGYLRQSLKSLVSQNFSKDKFEVIVVDDGGQDNLAAVIGDFSGKLDLKYFKEKHLNVCHARNVGIKNARGDILVFFDDDAVADSHWLESISRIMEKENVVVGRGKPLNDNMWQYFAPHYDRGDQPIEISTIWECNLAVKKAVFAAIGLFDEKIGWGHEGNEFARRCQGKYRLMYYPEMIIFHDYAFGLINYFLKQKKFGEKLIYLKINGIKNIFELFFNYKKIKGAGEGQPRKIASPSGTRGRNDKLQRLPFFRKLIIKIVAKIGSGFHFYGSVVGYFKYKK